MKKQKLIDLYSKTSKHSNYQSLPSILLDLVGSSEFEINSRYERERLNYIQKYVSFDNKSVMDIGGNTGFFTFESLMLGASQATIIEGNKAHTEFVEEACRIVGLADKISIENIYFEFEQPKVEKKYDVTFLLNVLHHIGDDYGDQGLTIENAKNLICKQLNVMLHYTHLLVFQLGFNWMGNKNTCLFDNGTKKELIDFVIKCIDSNWEVLAIGIAEKVHGRIEYSDLNESNIQRSDSLGEFLNRPLFIIRKLTF